MQTTAPTAHTLAIREAWHAITARGARFTPAAALHEVAAECEVSLHEAVTALRDDRRAARRVRGLAALKRPQVAA